MSRKKLNIDLSGIDKVMKNLNSVFEKIEKDCYPALIECSIVIRRDMTNTAPKVPVDLRNLEHSWFAVTRESSVNTSSRFTGPESSVLSSDHSAAVSESKSLVSAKRKPSMVMGFSANYAVYVHEMVDANFARPKDGKSRRPGAGAKFFERALQRNEKQMLQILQNHLKI